MEKITELLNNFSLEKYVPKLDTLMGWVQWLVSLAVRIGPLCILILGLIYLLIPPKEANRKAGFRTYFGMGSIMAWNFTQRIAGALMIPTGLVLTLIAYSKVGKLASYDLMTIAHAAYDIIKVQVICAFVIFVVMFLVTAVMFNRNGVCRFPVPTNTWIGRFLFKEEMVKASDLEQHKEPETQAPEEIPVAEYEVQGQQVITADDIVIEDL